MAGKLRLEELVTRRWRLDEINEAYADMLTGDVARGVIVFWYFFGLISTRSNRLSSGE